MADNVVPFPQRGGRRHHQTGVDEPTPSGGLLRRGTEPPDDLRSGLGFDYEDHERTRSATIRATGRGSETPELTYQTGRKFGVDDEGLVKGRALFGWFGRADERIGAMRFEEWHPSPGLPGDEFVEAMDELSLASHNLSLVLADAWEMEELSESGPILEFSRLWVHPGHSKGSVWAPLVEALIRRRYEKRFSILVLKAFPLEYEDAMGKGSPLERGFAARRQKAMERLYARLLGVRPLPSDHGAEGWMWRPLREGAPCPLQRSKVRPRW